MRYIIAGEQLIADLRLVEYLFGKRANTILNNKLAEPILGGGDNSVCIHYDSQGRVYAKHKPRLDCFIR